MRPIPQCFFDLVEREEACPAAIYPDSTGRATGGYGHTGGLTPADIGKPVSRAQAMIWLAQDAPDARADLYARVKPDVIDLLTDNQYGALIDFCFNVGDPTGDLWTVLNAKQFDQVPMHLMAYDKAKIDGKFVKLNGLVNRRTAEVQLWSTDEPGSADVTLPSSVTRAIVTPPTPVSVPKGLSLAVGTVVTVGPVALANLQTSVQAVNDAITPYASGSQIFQHVQGLCATVGGGCALALLAFVGFRKWQATHWRNSTKGAGLSLPSAKASTMTDTFAAPGAAEPSTTVAAAPAPAPATPAQPIPNELAAIRDSLGRALAKLGVEVEEFTGKTVSEIIAEAKKLAAAVEAKL